MIILFNYLIFSLDIFAFPYIDKISEAKDTVFLYIFLTLPIYAIFILLKSFQKFNIYFSIFLLLIAREWLLVFLYAMRFH